MLAFSAVPAAAQFPPPSPPANPPSARLSQDGNGINPATGQLSFSFGAVSTGGEGGDALSYQRSWEGTALRDQTLGWVQLISGVYHVSIGPATERFNSSFQSLDGTGSTLSQAGMFFTYTLSDGTVIEFCANDATVVQPPCEIRTSDYPQQNIVARIQTITRPDGVVTTYHYRNVVKLILGPPDELIRGTRVQSITNNLGYQLFFTYASNTWDIDPNDTPAENETVVREFNRIIEVTALNNTVDYCAPTGFSCTSLTEDWPSVTFAYQTSPDRVTATDNLGRAQTVTTNTAGQITRITRPEAGDEDIELTYSNGRVATYNDGAGTWGYSYTVNGSGQITQTVIDPPVGGNVTVAVNTTAGLPSSVTNGTGNTTSYLYDTQGRNTRVTMPEGNYVQYTYDARSNVTEARQVAKAGSGLADIASSASFPATCSNPVNCNRPTTTTDPRGNVTNYSWSGTHGGLLSVTLPDPDGAGPLPRPETRYTYAQQYARYRVGGGAIANAPSQVWRLTRTESCATGTSCNGAANELESVLNYGAGTSAATNLRLATATARAGNGSLEQDIVYTYDPFGNVLTQAEEYASGSFRTTTYRYNAGIQLEGVIAPDPDGAGAQLNLAQRFVYDDNGNVTRADFGTVTGTTQTAWNNFAVAQSMVSSYDNVGRLSWREVRQNDGGSATRFAHSDFTYDAGSRLTCSAMRMNPAEFASPPASACTLDTAGSFGPDRISRNHYDNANRVLRTEIGVGTSALANAFVRTYNANGTAATLADGNGNLTTYVYDGFDRLRDMRYPNGSGGGSSTTDFERYTYDAASNVTQLRLRDTTTIAYTYDNLNRRTLMNLPGSDPDVTYSYDNFSRLLTASQTGNSLTFTYDIFGRQLTEAGPLGTVTRQYRIDGARERITHPDSNYFHSTYTALPQRQFLYRNATSGTENLIDRINYDALNRPSNWYGDAGTVATRVQQTFAYDSAQRLGQLVDGMAGTANDLTIGLSYNPAWQSAQRTLSNDNYVYDEAAAGTTTYTPDGLNRYGNVNPPGAGSITPTYDERGNLTGYGSDSFAYDSLNRLTSATVGGQTTAFAYDPLGRLYSVNAPGTANDHRLLSDGASVIAEYAGLSGSTVARRYYHDQGSLGAAHVLYEGSTVSLANQRYLLTDELGSVVALAAGSTGALTASNSYGPYGEPASGNVGLYQYAGQIWNTQAGLQYMRNRWYHPRLGRFMQTDPIGYQGGMNLYAYVGNDPVNLTDPSGLCGTGTLGITGSRLCRRIDSGSSSRLLPGISITPGPAFGGLLQNAHGGTSTVNAFVSSGSRVTVGDSSGASGGSSGGSGSCDMAICVSGDRLIGDPPSAINGFFVDPVVGVGSLPATVEEELDQIVVSAQRRGELAGVSIRWRLRYPLEQHWLTYGENEIVYIGILGRRRGDTGQSAVIPPRPNPIALIHSHPRWAVPGPGPRDFGHNIPIYGISPRGAWVIRPGASSETWLSGNGQ